MTYGELISGDPASAGMRSTIDLHLPIFWKHGGCVLSCICMIRIDVQFLSVSSLSLPLMKWLLYIYIWRERERVWSPNDLHVLPLLGTIYLLKISGTYVLLIRAAYQIHEGSTIAAITARSRMLGEIGVKYLLGVSEQIAVSSEVCGLPPSP